MSLTVEKCLQAWTNSLRQMNAKADIVFFGDSLTYYGEFSSVFPNKVVCNLGLRGDTIQGMIDRVEQVKMLNPKIIFLMAGINDVGNVSSESFFVLYNTLVDNILKAIPNADVIIQSMLPVNTSHFRISCTNKQILECNDKIELIANHKNVKYYNLFSVYNEKGELPVSFTKDGIHIIQDAYKKWYALICN